MKKILFSTLCLIMALGLASCGTQSSDVGTTVEDSAVNQSGIEENVPEESDAELGDTNETEDDGLSDDTLGGKLAIEFKNLIKDESDIAKVAEALSDEDFCGYSCGVMDVEEGFLNGFTEEINGFNEGVAFMPMIGSIPFIGYIFETDDVEGLKDTLLSKADPRWNICTQADETVCITSGGYVFFTMCPEE